MKASWWPISRFAIHFWFARQVLREKLDHMLFRRLVRPTFLRRRGFANAILLASKCVILWLTPKHQPGASEVSGKE
jgi:hypothetical protein